MSDLFVDNIKHQSSQGSGTITIGASGEKIDLGATAGGTFTARPAFHVNLDGTSQLISSETNTKIEYTNAVFDTDSAFDTSTNYRFTVPSGKAGKYFLYGQYRMSSNADFGRLVSSIRKNGTSISETNQRNEDEESATSTIVVDLSVGDYVEHFGYHNAGSAKYIFGDAIRTFFLGYRLIGA